MSDLEPEPLDLAALSAPAKQFLAFCDEELERRRNSGEAFNETELNEATALVLRRLTVLAQERGE